MASYHDVPSFLWNIIIMYLVLQLKCLNLSFVSVLVLFVFRLCSCIVLGGVGRMVG